MDQEPQIVAFVRFLGVKRKQERDDEHLKAHQTQRDEARSRKMSQQLKETHSTLQ